MWKRSSSWEVESAPGEGARTGVQTCALCVLGGGVREEERVVCSIGGEGA